MSFKMSGGLAAWALMFMVVWALGCSCCMAHRTNSSGNNSNAVEMSTLGNNSCNPDHGEGIHLVSLRWQEVGVYFTVTTFVIMAGFAKLAFHRLHCLSRKVPESCVLVILGLSLGLVIFFITHDKSPSNACQYQVELPHFTSNMFFFVLLPPIVLESAYSLHDRAFFDNLGTVLVFAFIGTMFNVFTIGPSLYGLAAAGAMGNISFSISECLVFSSLISAVDPVAVLAIFQELGVNKHLYFLIFGESLLNDGVTVMLYNTIQTFMSMEHIELSQYALAVVAFVIVVLGGITIGIIFGFLTALITKIATEARVVEPLALLGLSYLSYLTAELFHFSGIISLIVCGLVQAQFAFENISQKSYTCVKYFTKMASATSDTVIFMFLGMVLVSDDHVWHTGFVLWSVFLCFIMRFIGVFVLTAIMNNYRVKKINLEEQFITAYGGLRGAVAFSLVNMLDEAIEPRRIFVTTTLVVILFTIFVQGMTIKPLVNLLHIQKRKSERKSLIEEVNYKVMDHIMAGVEEIVGQHGDFYLRELMVYYNDRYLKKWFLRPSCESKLLKLFEKIALSEHYAHLYGPVAMIEDKVKPLGVSSNTETEIRSATFSRSHKDEVHHQSRLNLEDDVDENMDNIPGFIQDGSVELRKKRSSLLPTLQNRVASETSEESWTHDSREAQALQRALRSNPYNKLHYKYNRNLVREEEQELAEHLHRRHLNAKRMTRLASSTRLPSTYNQSSQLASRPRTASCHVQLSSGVEELVERHNIRCRTMSMKQRAQTMQSGFSSPEPSFPPASPSILQALQEGSEPAFSLPNTKAQVSRPSTVGFSPMESASASSDPEECVPLREMDSRKSVEATEDF